MKFLTCLTITLALAAPLVAQTPVQIPSQAEVQAKRELNEAARAYREGNFAAAQAHSERALQLDPQNKAAPMFIARTIHAQYKPGNSTPQNAQKAREAIIAYQRILDRTPGDDEAYKAVAYLYGDLKEYELLREWILHRAGDASLPNDKRAEAYIVLTSRDWDCSFKITELPTNKLTIVKGNKIDVSYRMPKERLEFERAKECATRGLNFVNMALALSPDNESGWAYKTNILLELEKLAEMSREIQLKRELHRQYEEARNEATRLSKRSQPTP